MLATVTDADFATHLSDIPFSSRLIGAAYSERDRDAPTASDALGIDVSAADAFLFRPKATAHENILSSVELSEIELLRCLSGAQRRALAESISLLPPVQSLYGTQLDAFCCALARSAHCTQGPPGTGKVWCVAHVRVTGPREERRGKK